MTGGAGDSIGPATGLRPGALSGLLAEVATAPESQGAEPASLPSGTVIGRYEIVRELGRGGFAVVYEARDRELGRPVAVKLVRPGRITEEAGKVSREAEAIARLAHPNLVTLFDVGRTDGGPYLVFEFLRGKSLQERMDDGTMSVQEAVHVALKVARGLAHAHAEGVVHRDLKPSNVFITNRGQVKVLDFGLAHAFGRRSISGGTPAYMAPEQWEDAPEDERADVFALGVMLYRMLSGGHPYPEGHGRWAAEPAPVRRLEVPGAPELAELVEKMLDPVPTHRPRDGAAVLAALAPIEEKLRARPADGKPPEPARRRKATFSDLLAELKRRRVFRVMVGYGFFAFAVLQVTEPIMHGANLPSWVLKAVIVALALGFLVAVTLAWIFDLTAQGVRRTPSASGPGAPSFGRSRLLLPFALSVAVLALAIGGGSAWYAQHRPAGTRVPAEATGAPPSIAVLPFADLSPEKDQDYFAEGVAEEIRGVLSRVAGLRVPGRASSFWFKGKNVEPAEIARRLGVVHLLEGSVRRSGTKLRITAEVVKASSGDRVWGETYERELTDVFAIQDEIARSVLRELAPILLDRCPPPPPPATTDPEAYRLFVLGRYLNAQGAPDSGPRALEAVERATAIDPRYAPAQAMLAFVLSIRANIARGEEFRRLRKRWREAADRAVALDPSSSYGYVARAFHRLHQDLDWDGVREDLDRAQALAPTDDTVLNGRAYLLRVLGQTRESVETQRRAVELNPLNVIHTTNLASALVCDGQYSEAREWALRSLAISPDSMTTSVPARMVLGMVSLLTGKAEDALVEYDRGPEPLRSAGIVAALHSLGRDQESRDALARLERDRGDAPVAIASARAWRGDVDGAFAALERAFDERAPMLAVVKTWPLLRPLHADPRWEKFLRKMKLPVD